MASPIPTTFEAESHARRMSLDGGNSIRLPTSSGPSIPSDSILTSPNYSYIFGFEKDFDHVEVKEVGYVSNYDNNMIYYISLKNHTLYDLVLSNLLDYRKLRSYGYHFATMHLLYTSPLSLVDRYVQNLVSLCVKNFISIITNRISFFL